MKNRIFFAVKNIVNALAACVPSPHASRVILCYHSIGDIDWDYNVKLNDFKQQIEYLLTLYQPTTLGSIIHAPNPSFALTFDDGYQSLLNIKDFLKSKNIKPTLFLLSDTDNINHNETDNNLKLLSDTDIRLLIKDGWEIGSHGSQHRDYWKLTDVDTSSEIVESKNTLESRFKIPVRYFSYPKGRYSSIIVDQVKQAGYQLAVVMDDGILNQATDPYLIPRIGIDRTHDLKTFKKLLTTSTITTRKYFKKLGSHLLAKLI